MITVLRYGAALVGPLVAYRVNSRQRSTSVAFGAKRTGAAVATGSRPPTPPAELCEDAKLEWERVAPLLQQLGTLCEINRAALAAYCQAYGRWLKAERAIATMAERDQLTSGLMIKTTNGNPIQNPLVGIANRAMVDMVRYAAEFGMAPSARSRIAKDPFAPDPQESFAQFWSLDGRPQ